MVERLTERWCAGGIRIKGCSTLYQDVERKSAPMASAIARLAAYEDTGLEPEGIQRMKEYMEPFTIRDIDRFNEIMQAEKDGRLVVLEPAAKKGGEKPPCFYNDMGQALCLGFARGECDDEPIDRCKECWYCESTREEAGTCTLALKKD